MSFLVWRPLPIAVRGRMEPRPLLPAHMEEHFSSCCLALQAMCASMETMLGPQKNLKCYLACDGQSGILGDSMQVLDALMSSYRHHRTPSSLPNHTPSSLPDHTHPPPALQLLYECCHEHHMTVGCGTTTLICLSAYWASEILHLRHQGIPDHVIAALFREALHKCNHLMEGLLIQVPRKPAPHCPPAKEGVATSNVKGVWPGTQKLSKRQAKAMSFSRHHQQSQGKDVREGETVILAQELSEQLKFISVKLGRGREMSMKLALDTRQLQPEGLQSMVPLIHCMVGKPEAHSRVVRGVVCDVHQNMLALSRDFVGKKLRVLVIAGDCTPYSTHLGLERKAGHVMSHDLSQLFEESREAEWLNQSISIIKKFKVDVLIVSGSVCPSLWQQSIGVGVLILCGFPASSCKHLQDLCGAWPLSYLTQCAEGSIGVDVSMEILDSALLVPNISRNPRKTPPVTKHSCRLYKAPPSSPTSRGVVTALLCSLTEYGVENLKHHFTNACHRLHWATEGIGHTPPIDRTPPRPRTKAAAGVVTYQLLPGGGRTEAACIHMLEKVREDEDYKKASDSSPLYFTNGWMSQQLVQASAGWRRAGYQAFANGLRRYLVRGLTNSRPDTSVFEAMGEAEEMVRQLCEDRVSVVNKAWHRGGEENCEVLDVAISKKKAWHKAVHLLETLLLSKRVDLKH